MNNKNLKNENVKNTCHPELDSGSHINTAEAQRFRIKSGMTDESGRSMVEMLGVLAIIGVLTIIGIAGFKIAMNKAKANNLVADMNRLAHIVVMDKFSGYSEEAIQNVVTEHNNDTAYPAECNSAFKSAMFSLTLKNPIDKEMCEQVANLGWAVPQGVFLNEVEKKTLQAEDCTDANTLTWVFMDDLSHCSDCVLSDTKCGTYGNECGSCSDLRGYTRDDSKCANNANGQYCLEGFCGKCDVGQFWYASQTRCTPCQDINDYWWTQPTNKHNCLGEMFYADSKIYGCTGTRWDESVVNVDKESCIHCENRCYNAYKTSCPFLTYGYMKEEDGSCGDCREGYFWFDSQKRCIPCQNVNDYWWSRESNKHNCLSDMYWREGKMFSCNYTSTANGSQDSNADELSCTKCNERCYLTSNGSCQLMGTTYTKDETTGHCITTQ